MKSCSNRAWEGRGNLIRAFFLSIVFLLGSTCLAKAEDIESLQTRQQAEENLTHVTRGDIAFFFDRISFQDGGWIFKLSPNVRGMLWRINGDKTDVTGACESGQILNVQGGASLLIKRKDMDLHFDASNPISFHVRLITRTEIGGVLKTEMREAQLRAYHGNYALAYEVD